MTKYIVRGDQFRITADSNLIVKDKLPVGTYTVYFDELASEFFLKPIEAYTLGKLYGDAAVRWVMSQLDKYNIKPHQWKLDDRPVKWHYKDGD